MMLRIPAIVLIHLWPYDFYDMSTGKQGRHMIMLFIRSQAVYKYHITYLSDLRLLLHYK